MTYARVNALREEREHRKRMHLVGGSAKYSFNLTALTVHRREDCAGLKGRAGLFLPGSRASDLGIAKFAIARIRPRARFSDAPDLSRNKIRKSDVYRGFPSLRDSNVSLPSPFQSRLTASRLILLWNFRCCPVELPRAS